MTITRNKAVTLLVGLMLATIAVVGLTAQILGTATPAQAAGNDYRMAYAYAGPGLKLTVTSWLNFQNPQFPRTYHISATGSYGSWRLASVIFDGYNYGARREFTTSAGNWRHQVMARWASGSSGRSCIVVQP